MINSYCKCNLRWFVGVVWRKMNTPPWYGLSLGPIIMACLWTYHPPTGPAEHCAGGSWAKLLSSLLICFSTIVCAFCLAPISVCAWRSGQNSWWSQWLGRIVSSSHTSSARHRRRGAGDSLTLRTQPPPHGAAGASLALWGSKHSLLLSTNFQHKWQDNSRGAKNSLFNKCCQDIQNRYSHM